MVKRCVRATDDGFELDISSDEDQALIDKFYVPPTQTAEEVLVP